MRAFVDEFWAVDRLLLDKQDVVRVTLRGHISRLVDQLAFALLKQLRLELMSFLLLLLQLVFQVSDGLESI